MIHANSSAPKTTSSWFWRPLLWIARILKFIFKLSLTAWGCLALYYSNLPWFSLRLTLAILFVGFSIWSLWISKKSPSLLLFALVYFGILIWWSTIVPSHDRNWRPEVAVMPKAIINGDNVRFTGFRNFDYRDRNDFTVRYEAREISLAHLIGVDFFISYWMPGPIGHTFLSFVFDNAPPVSISIETRPEVGQDFAPLASLFKQFELIYVVGDERDLVRVRTNFRGETVYLYHLNISPQNARALFMVYLKRINELAKEPEFYNLLSNSCTINILRYANAAGRVGRFNFRHLFNGLIDGYLYNKGWLNNTLPFDELRRRSQINQKAKEADKNPDFSRLIRISLPPMGS